MTRESHRPKTLAPLCACVLAASLLGCTDAQLYHLNEVPSQPNKVAFTGTVCTDNPAERSFPLKVVYLVDTSPDLPPDLDAAGVALVNSRRVQAVRDSLTVLRGRGTSFALVRFGGTSVLASGGAFTDNSVDVAEAAGTLTLSLPNVGEGGRRTLQGFQLAASLITGDLLQTAKGPRSRTKYVVVLVQAGAADDALLNAQADPAGGCDNACILARRVDTLREAVLEAGAADFQLHTLDLTPALTDDDAWLEPAALELEQMAFSGAGLYKPVCVRRADGTVTPPGCGAQNLSLLGVDIKSARNVFITKSFFVANMSARHTPDGAFPDSDGDGIPDHLEDEDGDGLVRPSGCADGTVCADDVDCAGIGDGACVAGETDPARRDTDGDGINDKVEKLLATVGLNPLRQDSPVQCANIESWQTTDTDGDGLTDCEEVLLGLDPTLFDTDGDGVPDQLEVLYGTNFLEADALRDLDFDGVSNYDEVRGHSDPRSSDATTRAELSYLYREVDLGIREHRFASQPRNVPGVQVEAVSPSTSVGNGTLVYLTDDPPLLAWRDAEEDDVGDAVRITDDGAYVLQSGCTDEVDKDCDELDRSITVNVTRSYLPPFDVEELLRVSIAERQCTDFRVRNVTLVETLEADGRAAGNNDIRIFFGQVPQGSEAGHGIFRVAQYNFRYLEPDLKEPDVADQPVDSYRFVLFGE